MFLLPWLLIMTIIEAYHFVIIPGMGGSILHDPITRHRVWPPRLFGIKHLYKMELDGNCTTLEPGDTEGIRIQNPFSTRSFYNPMIDELLRHNHTVSALPYDFRNLNNQVMVMFREYLERQPTPVVVVCHSLGGLVFHDFITRHVSPSWARERVLKIYWISVPFAGCPESVYSVLTNTVFKLPPMLATLRYFDGFYVTFPFLPNDPVISRGGKIYTPTDYETLLTEEVCLKRWFRISTNLDARRRRTPPVPSTVVYTDDLSTRLVIDLDDHKKHVYGRGDGLVPIDSLRFPLRWWEARMVSEFRVQGSEHTRICADHRVLSYLSSSSSC